MKEQGIMAHPSDRAGQATPEAASASSPSGDHPLRDVVASIRAKLDEDELMWLDFHQDGAWHAGYEAGARTDRAYDAGYATAERDVLEWLSGVIARRIEAKRPAKVTEVMEAVRFQISHAAHRARDAGGEAGETPTEARPAGPQPDPKGSAHD